MMGMVESYNVSVACAIILAEAQRQRDQAGLYGTTRLNPDLYQYRLFRWCQPIVAKFCDERGLAYPELDQEGEIINPSAWYQAVREGRAPLQSYTPVTPLLQDLEISPSEQ